MKIKTEIINEIDRLKLLFDRLNSPSQKEIIPSLCTSKPWIINWLNHYLNDADKLFVCVQQTDDRLIAIYPLYLKKISFGFELRFIGSGEPEIAEVSSEFQDFIINPAYSSESLQLFTQQVKQLKRCQKISFEYVLSDSLCMQWLKNYTKRGWHIQEQRVGIRFKFEVLQNEQQQILKFSNATLRRQARRFNDREDIQIEYCDEDSKIIDYFNNLIELHTLQWRKRGKPGAFTTKDFRQFHLDFAAMMLKNNQLLLFKLLVQEKCIAVFYGFYHHDTLYYYQSGISENSPLLNTGVAMHLIAMRHARTKQIKIYDLMAGKVNSYKTQYLTADTEVFSVYYSTKWFLNGKPLYKIKEKLKRLIRFVLS